MFSRSTSLVALLFPIVFSSFLSPLAFLGEQRKGFHEIATGCLGFNAHGCGMTFVGVSQTQYTPANIRTDTLIKQDRPYVGLLAASGGHTLLRQKEALRTQLDVGITGRPSLARETQTLAHYTWAPGAARPRGWNNQLRAAPHLQLSNQYSRTMLSTCDDGAAVCSGWSADQVFRTETSFGTVLGRASQGAVFRAGDNMPRLEGSDRTHSGNATL